MRFVVWRSGKGDALEQKPRSAALMCLPNPVVAAETWEHTGEHKVDTR